MLIEVKQVGDKLSVERASQLYRYFSVTKARIAILTTGVIYRFYSDLDEPNKMDQRPFLELDLTDLRDNHLAQLKRLTKEEFDLETMLLAAEDLKWVTALSHILEQQFESPDEELVKFFYRRANPGGRFTQAVGEQFAPLVKRALSQAVSERVGARLRSALHHEDVATMQVVEAESVPAEDGGEEVSDGVVTTEDELRGFRVVEAILCEVVDVERITQRDTKSYFGVLIDDNNRKPVCRLHFNRTQWYIGLFDESKKETRHPISNVKEIYGFAAGLRDAAKRYL
jgi:hypothetical protein